MNQKPKTRAEESDADRHLRESGSEFVRSTSGLYHPKTEVTEQKISIDINATVADPFRVSERPRSSLSELFANLIASVAGLISLFTLIGLAFTVYFTQKQFHEAVIANRLNQQANQSSQIASRNAQVAAEKSFLLSRQSLVDVQRAFIFSESSVKKLTNRDGSLQGYSMGVNWQNSGTTPTQGLEITEWYRIAGGNFDGDPTPFESDDHPIVDKKTFIPPKGAYNTHISIIQPWVLDLVLKYQKSYVFWGTAKYKDVFLGTKEHVTKYCYLIEPVATEIERSDLPASIIFDVNQCSKHNCIDEECQE